MIWSSRTTGGSWATARRTEVSSAPQGEWEDQLLVSASASAPPSTSTDVPTISVRRLNPHGSEAAEARRRREEAFARAERASARGRRAGHPVLLALGAAAVAATAWLSFADTTVREPTPAALIGAWTPAHPDYAGAQLAFTPSAITISSPSGEPSTQPIESLRTTAEPGGVLLELTYRSPDGPVSLRATLQTDAAPPRLVFEHPVGLAWERAAAIPSP